MRVILVDDERYSLEVLENLLSKEEGLEIVGSYIDPKDALAELDKTMPDGALLDMEMPGMNGLELGEQLMNIRPEMEIIFVTAYAEYALDAFEVSAIDYILKSVNEKRLSAAIQRLKNRVENRKLSGRIINDIGENRLKINTFGGFEVYDFQGNTMVWRTKKTKELFAYLWYKGNNGAGRDRIIEDVFPDKSADRSSALLHTTIYQLRNSLRQVGYNNPVRFVNEHYSLNIPIDSDGDKINAILKKRSLTEADIDEIINTHRGEFMEESYPWIQGAKYNYYELGLNILSDYVEKKLRTNHITKRLENVIKLMIEVDPFTESYAGFMMSVLGKQGKIKELEKFYQEYKIVIMQEIGEGLSKETEDLYKLFRKSLE